MHFTVELPEDVVAALTSKAERLGVTPAAYLLHVVERDLKGRSGRAPRHISAIIADIAANVPAQVRVRQLSKPNRRD